MFSITLVALLAAHLIVFVAWRRVSPLHPLGLFPVLYLAWFTVGTATLVDVPDNFSFGLLGKLPVDVTPMVIAGYVAYLVGVGLALMLRQPDAANAVPTWPGWHPFRAKTLVVGMLGIGLLAFLALVGQMGVPILSPDVAVARERVNDHASTLIVLLTATFVLAAIGTRLISDGTARAWGWARRMPLIVWVLPVCLVALATRTYVLNAVLVAIAVHSLSKRPLRWRSLVILGVVVLAFVGVSNYIRDRAVTAEGVDDLLISSGIPAALLPVISAYFYLRYTVAGFAQLVTLIPSTVPYHYGALSISPLFTFLPGHREQWDIYFKNLLGFDFAGAGIPTTLLGTLYADGGILAIVIGLTIFAFFITALYRIATRRNAGPAAQVVYAWMWYVAIWSLYTNLLPYITSVTTPLIIAICTVYAQRGVLPDGGEAPAQAIAATS